MAYCLNSDVGALIALGGFTLSGSSTPTTTTVDAWIDQHSASVDAALTRAGYSTVPATGTADLLMLKRIVAEGVALKTLYVAFDADDVPKSLETMLMDFDEALEDIRTGDLILPDQGAPASASIAHLDLNIDTDLNDLLS